MKSSQNKKTSFKSKILVLSAALVLAGGIAVWAFFSPKNSYKNYAEQIARPIEKTLLESGARKICSTGDAGHGPDNQSPNYGAFYETDLNLSDATSLIKKVSVANGFNLTAGQSAYPEIHPYFDHKTKTSPYTQLKSGPIILSMSLYDGGDKLGCAGKDMIYDKEHTAIKLDIALPEFK